MNVFAAVIVTALMVNFAVSVVADLLNLGALRPGLPAEMKGVWDEGAYRKSQEYTLVGTKFGLVRQSVDLLALLIFWFAGGFNALDGMVRGWGFGAVLTGLLFVASLLLLSRTLTLPFSLYDTFVIEEKFGFNRTTPGTYVLDRIKGGMLAALLGGPLLAGILALFEFAGPAAWFTCWLCVTVYILAVQFVAPAWIMPLFNRFAPLKEGELRRSIMDYAGSVGFSLKDVFVVDGSRRSSKSNAFFTGFGRNKRIALFDTLVEEQSTEELVAVLAHEIGHYKKRHVQQGMALSVIHTGAMLFLLSLVIGSEGLFEAFRMEHLSIHAGMVFFGLLLTPVEMVLSVLLNLLSRKNEYEADRFAAETTGSPEVLIAALKRLSVRNLANLTPHPFAAFLRYSHPPLLERIGALRAHES
jgi:STE24 endopeptidase